MFFEIKLVGQPLHRDRLHKWIGDDDFFFAQRRRVAIESGLGIGLQQLPNPWQAGEKLDRPYPRNRPEILSGQFLRGIVFQTFGNLILQFSQDKSISDAFSTLISEE